MAISLHKFIQISSHALAPHEAEARVYEALSTYNVGRTQVGPGAYLTLKDGAGGETVHSFDFLVAETQKTGVIPEVDRLRWRDTNKHGAISVAIDGSMRGADFNGMLLTSGSITTKPFVGPGYATTDAAADLLEDLLTHGEGVATNSHITDSFRAAAREFRAYLASAITSVEAYVMREAQLAGLAKKINRDANLGEKVDFVASKLAHGKGKKVTRSAEWAELDELRLARNSYVHQREPTHPFELERVIAHMNRCRIGVGQLLIDMCQMFKRHPHPNVIAVRYAPEAVFVPKSNGAGVIMAGPAARG